MQFIVDPVHVTYSQSSYSFYCLTKIQDEIYAFNSITILELYRAENIFVDNFQELSFQNEE